jgi:hypothetical protein
MTTAGMQQRNNMRRKEKHIPQSTLSIKVLLCAHH